MAKDFPVGPATLYGALVPPETFKPAVRFTVEDTTMEGWAPLDKMTFE